MTIGAFAECLDCNHKYKIRYGVGNNYPQFASFECIKCLKKINTGFKEYKGKEIIDKAIEIRFKEAKESVKILNKTEHTQLSILLKKLLFSLDG